MGQELSRNLSVSSTTRDKQCHCSHKGLLKGDYHVLEQILSHVFLFTNNPGACADTTSATTQFEFERVVTFGFITEISDFRLVFRRMIARKQHFVKNYTAIKNKLRQTHQPFNLVKKYSYSEAAQLYVLK